MLPTLAAWLHDIDPFAIRIAGDFGIRWYGLSYLVGFAIAWLLVRRVAHVGRSPLTLQQVGDMILVLAIGVVVGGRLGYVLFYQRDLLWPLQDSFPWWGVLALNQGGMASHGGMIGGLLACWWFARRQGLPLLHLFDLFAFGAPLGLFFGRIANFVNGELIGRGPTAVPWAVKFPQAIRDWPADQRAKLYRALETVGYDPGGGGWIERVTEAVQQGNQTVIAVLEPMLTPRHPSQLYAAVLEGLVVFAVLLYVWRKPRKPGLVAAWFAISYGLMRIIDEIWRRPDAHLLDAEFRWTQEVLGFGISRGQWLSALLLAVGVWGIWYASRRPVEPLGAWRRGPWTPVKTDKTNKTPEQDASK